MPWLAPAVAAVTALGVLLWSLPRGLDLTDEGYYLTEIAHPGDSSATALLFGWAWHPVYAVTGGSVLGLRFVGFALVVGLSVALTLVLVSLAPGRPRPGPVTTACLCAVTAALACVPLSSLPFTPSYNTLAWLTLAAAALGCALAWSGRRPALGGVLVGLAGAAAATAKPTTALALAVAVALTTPWRRMGPRPVAAATGALIACFAVLVSLAPGHLGGLVDVVTRGVQATVGHADLIRRDPYLRSLQVLLPLTLAGVSGAVAGVVSVRRARAGAVLGVASVALAVVSLWRWWDVGLVPAIDTLLPTAALTCFGVVGLVAVVTVVKGRGSAPPDPVAVRLAVLLTLLPAAYAIGTNNNLWHWAGQAVVFWFLAIVLLVGTSGPVAAAAGALAAYTVLVSAVVTPLDPYRNAPLTDTQVTQVSLAGATVRLPPDEARATSEMLAVGERLGVTRQTRVLDLTGASPGVVWAWGARPLASGWVIGGYPESLDAARTSIEPARCDLDRALVLWAPDHPRAIPGDVLAPWGVDLPGDYRVVGTFPRVSVAATRAAPTPTLETVTVLEPVTVTPRGCPAG